MPTVSVIMNCLNGEKYLREAIDSIYAQTYKDWEIIFWDNCSTDSSSDIAKSYDTKLRYFKGDKTVPLYAARNLALKEAQGKYIAFLDCDDYWLPQKLERQVEIFQKRQDIGLIYTNVAIMERNGSKRNKFYRMQPSGRIFRNMLKNYNVNIATAMVSKNAICSIYHYFDDSLNFSGDADLFLRISHDWEVYYLPHITAVYREHDSSFTATRPDTILKENEYILDKFSKIYRGFYDMYFVEIASFKKYAKLSVIIALWKSGKNAEARHFAKKNITSLNIFTVLYLLSFFSFSHINSIRKRIFC